MMATAQRRSPTGPASADQRHLPANPDFQITVTCQRCFGPTRRVHRRTATPTTARDQLSLFAPDGAGMINRLVEVDRSHRAMVVCSFGIAGRSWAPSPLTDYDTPTALLGVDRLGRLRAPMRPPATSGAGSAAIRQGRERAGTARGPQHVAHDVWDVVVDGECGDELELHAARPRPGGPHDQHTGNRLRPRDERPRRR